jgi:hypothetical protein
MYELTMQVLLYLSALCVLIAFLSTRQGFILSTDTALQITLRDLYLITA